MTFSLEIDVRIYLYAKKMPAKQRQLLFIFLRSLNCLYTPQHTAYGCSYRFLECHIKLGIHLPEQVHYQFDPYHCCLSVADIKNVASFMQLNNKRTIKETPLLPFTRLTIVLTLKALD